MRKIGMVVAVEGEALRQKYGEGYDLGDGHGTVLYQTQKSQVYALQCAPGEILAASATQYLIDRYEVSTVLNYGVVGACSESMKAGDTCVVSRAVHHQYDVSSMDGIPPGQYPERQDRFISADAELAGKAVSVFPSLRLATCASGDKFMDAPEEKIRLHEEFEADICDMEAVAILLTCNRNHVPCLLVKTVSNGVRGGAAEHWNEKGRTARVCLDIVDQLIDEL